MSLICVIGARAGSEGLVGKNIRPLLGKPLISWSIEQALESKIVDRLVVSTDSSEIAEIAKDAGAEVPFLRPKDLSTSDVGKFQVWKHALIACEEHFKETYDTFVDLDCTNPLRDASDICAAVRQFEKTRARGVNAVFTVSEARKNPYFNLVEPDSHGALRMSKSLPETVIARQHAPSVREHVASIYVLASEYVKTANHLLDGHAEGYDIGVSKSFDVDSEFDFELIEYLMKKKFRTPHG